jgi:phospholipid/cholesterol/gamma-HCH transport system substrate-binding protein
VRARRVRLIAAPLVLFLAVTAIALTSGGGGIRVVAYFPSAAGLYEGDAVKVMGVEVGEVRSIEPDGDRVRVELEISEQPVPAEAHAAIVAPSLVNERFVQLAPAYTEGEKMTSGAVITLDRTAIPVSFDDVKRELTDLSTALGPRPGEVDDTGSLNEAIRALDANLTPGTATRFKDSLTAMRGATASLSSGSEDLFTTLRNLSTFVENLRVNDRAMRDLTGGLAGFARVLDDNKAQLGSAVAGLDQALRLIRRFVQNNAGVLDAGVRNLAEVAATLASSSNDLAGFLHGAPTGLSALYNMVNNQALTARLSVNQLQDLAQLLCGSALGVGGTVAQCRAAIGPLLEVLGLRQLPGAPGAPTTPSTAKPDPQTGIGPVVPGHPIPLLDGLLASLLGGQP